MWKFLNSRHVATNLLLVMVALLMLSTFLPSELTLGEQNWRNLAYQSPAYFQIASHGATPYLVSTPPFLLFSLLLFLSTLSCTVERLRIWYVNRESDFARERFFSFSLAGNSPLPPESLHQSVTVLLTSGRWRSQSVKSGSSLFVSAQKGGAGFWGSILFHVGLLACFIAAPISAITLFRGELVITEGPAVALRDNFSAERGTPMSLPEASVAVSGLQGVYYKGRFKEDFGGFVELTQDGHTERLPVAVNTPVNYAGFQFSLHEFGYAPRVVIDKGDGPGFDYFLNLRHPDQGDYFDLGDGLSAFVMFFPDFFRDGGKIGSRSKEPHNPVTMVKLKRGEVEVFKGLFAPGEKVLWQGRHISVPEYRHWITLIVTRESGMAILVLGLVAAIAGLLVRFSCNERRIDFELSPSGQGTHLKVSGYSRYYPAFLEKEVTALGSRLWGEEGEM